MKEKKVLDRNTVFLDDTVEGITEAAKLIKEGRLVAFPTETVYGLGANAFDSKAVADIYKAKGRPSDNPMIVHLSSVDQVGLVAIEFSDMAKKLADAFWPGPMTLILKAKESVPSVVRGGLDTVGVRVPNHESARILIDKAATPVAAPSANLSGSPSPTCWSDVAEDMVGRIDGIIKGSPCLGGIESTVIDVTEDEPIILRPGLITKEMIEKITGFKTKYDVALEKAMDPDQEHALDGDALVPRAPGMKYKHYAPKAKVLIVEGDQGSVLEEQVKCSERGEKAISIIYDDGQEELAARELFAKLRAADRQGADLIIIRAMRREGLGFSLMNRMLKSAGYNVRRKR